MKAVILAGGQGSRLSEETTVVPKPLVEIGGKPILWHIMKIYSHYGVNDFIICCGYKGYAIKEYFANYHLHSSDITFDLKKNAVEIHQNQSEPWRVTLLDTGEKTETGGRLKRARDFIGEERFCMTYGDGVADVDIKKLILHHQKHFEGRGKKGRILATMTVVQQPGRFGDIYLDNQGQIASFYEKTNADGKWINGGFFVLEAAALDHIIGGDLSSWERDCITDLHRDGLLSVYPHAGFWQCMDNLREKNLLNYLWRTNSAQWCVWDSERRNGVAGRAHNEIEELKS